MKISLEGKYWFFLVVVGIGALASFLGYRNYTLQGEKAILEERLASTISTLEEFQQKFEMTKTERDIIEQNFHNEQSKVDTMTSKVELLTGVVGTLTKYVTTDKQLLAKYSKTYFLNENYSPDRLMQLDTSYKSSPQKEIWLQSDMWPFLKRMVDDAKAQGIDIAVLSAYRSFDTQSQLKTTYKVTYGAGTANQFSADQGYSEHQLGTAIDLTTMKIGDALPAFENATTYTWLTLNAYKYGFILSYPKNNEYYEFEPWHWRFVGVALATKLHEENKNFYTLDQREIDAYIVNLFDPIQS